MRRDVPLRRSLLVRLLALSALVSVCSVAATAWVVVRTTAVAIRQEQGQALADDNRIYDDLLGYAARHANWDGVTGQVAALAKQTRHRIVLTGHGHTFADSDSNHPYRPPLNPTAVIDPLRAGTGAADRIDPRAVGPFLLPPAERHRLQSAAQRSAACLQDLGIAVRITEEPTGRPHLVTPDTGLPPGVRCSDAALDDPTPTETKALTALNTLVDNCLGHHGAPGIRLALDGSWKTRSTRDPATTSCITASRAQQLTPYVAPTAQLYVSSPQRTATTFFDLSPANRARIAWGAALVLLVTVAVTGLAGVRLVRPLRALTHAARRMEDGDVSARVRVGGGDELASLSSAFNSMSERREQLESVRKMMVSDVAHELRTPLSNIRGWLEAAEDGVVAPDQALLASLLEEALLLQHIIDDLRDLYAADAGELRLRTQRLSVADLLAQTAAAHHGGPGVTLTVSVEGSPTLDADPVRLRQAVGNLVSNAVRHTPPGGTVTLRSRQDGDHVLIEVADTGTGISAAELPHVFDRFWRAEKSRSRATGGSGLGLSIVRKLTEAHGGTVSVTSTVGAGSVFALRLP